MTCRKSDFMEYTLPVIIKLALLAAGVIGQTTQGSADDFMRSSRWLYYTNISNLVIVAVIAVLLPYDVMRLVRRDGTPAIPNPLMALRFTATVGIALTFVVFSLLLTPQMVRSGNAGYLTTTGNICVHNLVPILAIVDFCLYAWPWETGKNTYLYGTIMPLAYVAFVYIGGSLGVRFGDGKLVPYFFFDYVENGWFTAGNGKLGTAYWLLILTVSVLLMGKALLTLKVRAAKKHAKTA